MYIFKNRLLDKLVVFSGMTAAYVGYDTINCIIFFEVGKSSFNTVQSIFPLHIWIKPESALSLALRETLAALVLLGGDMLRLAWSSSESAQKDKIQLLFITICYASVKKKKKVSIFKLHFLKFLFFPTT